MTAVRILTETMLRALVPLDREAVACIETAFIALAGGAVVMPPVLSMAIAEHNGEVDVKTAYVPGLDGFAIKVSPGFFNNPKIGLPSTSGLMILLSSRTGRVEALLLDNGYLTDVRTAAAGAVAARHLARPDASRAAILGAGMQARLQLHALCLERPIREATIWAREAARAQALADEIGPALGISARATDDREAAVRAADIVVTTTPSTEPLVEADWLRPGQHLTAMGSDQHGKTELAPDCLSRADLYVPDRQSQTAVIGELAGAIAAGITSPGATFAELGAVAAGKASGRPGDDAITICDLTGTGVQDTAIAALACKRAVEAGAGIELAI